MNKLALIGIFLFIFLNLLPGGFVRDTVDVAHFFSSVHMFEYAFKHEFQFGLKIIDNVGPYGYLHYPYIYSGGAYESKMFWYSLNCLVYAYYSTVLIKSIRSWLERSIFLFAIIFFPLQVETPWYAFEVIPRLAILFSAIYLLAISDKKSCWHTIPQIIFCGFFYSFLTLEKASNVYYLLLVISILFINWFNKIDWKYALWMVCSYLLGVVIFWLAAGQNLLTLVTYFKSISLFINAYQEVLGQELRDVNFLYALFYCFVAAGIILLRLGTTFLISQSRQLLSIEISRLFLISVLFFLSWKQGILRGNSSYGTFLYTVPILFGYLCVYPIKTFGNVSFNTYLNFFSFRAFFIFRSTLLAILLLVVGINFLSYEAENNHKAGFFQELNSRFRNLIDYRPWQTLKTLDIKFEKLKNEYALTPFLKESIQSGRVDEFGSVPEVILLNDLNYYPRPVPIDFVASNHALNLMNGRHYQNLESAPDFIFLSDFGLRLSDSLAYLSLLFNYQSIGTFKNWLIMKKRADEWKYFVFEKSAEREIDFGEWVSLEKLQKSFLWMELDISPSLLGSVKRFFYKPDFLQLDIGLEDGTIHSLPVSIAQLNAGFLLNPVIQPKNDILMIAQDKTQVPWYLAKAFRINMVSPEKSRLFEKKFKAQFYEIGSSFFAGSKPALLDSISANSLIKLFAQDFPIIATKFPFNLLAPKQSDDIVVSGLSGLESNGKESWRWAVGPSTRIKFYMDPILSDDARRALLKIGFKNGVPIPDQSVTILLNGTEIRRFTPEEIGLRELTEASILLNAKSGVNNLEISYEDWNHGKKSYGSNDPRKLAIVIMQLSLQLQHN